MRPPQPCRSCRSRARCGNAGPTSRRRAPRGFSPAARITPATATRSPGEMLEDFATIAGIEMVVIGADTTLANFKQDLRNNEVYYYLAQGFRA